MQSISQPNKLHPTLWQYCHTPSLLGFISNIAYWPHSGAPAVLTCSCCHFLAVRLLPHFALQHRTDHLCMTGRRQTTSEETCWVCLHGVLQTLDSEPYKNKAHFNPSEWYYCRWVRIGILRCKVYYLNMTLYRVISQLSKNSTGDLRLWGLGYYIVTRKPCDSGYFSPNMSCSLVVCVAALWKNLYPVLKGKFPHTDYIVIERST